MSDPVAAGLIGAVALVIIVAVLAFVFRRREIHSVKVWLKIASWFDGGAEFRATRGDGPNTTSTS